MEIAFSTYSPERELADLEIGVPYFSFVQPGGTFYVCCLRADKIVHQIDIRRRSENPVEGIQRDDNKKRIREISEYSTEEDAESTRDW